MSDEKKRLTHLDGEGRPTMVDVTKKAVTRRVAVATGSIAMEADTLAAIVENRGPKGDVLKVAEIAGIQGGKRTSDLIPLCHPLPGVSIEVKLEPDPSLPGVRATASAAVSGQTGVEMEALTAVAVALVTVYDMVKAIDKSMTIEAIQLERKEGGRSGAWER